MSGFTFAFLAMLFFGVGDSLFAIPSRKYRELPILFWQYFFIASVLSIVLILSGVQIGNWLKWEILFPITGGVFEVLGVMFLMKSLKKESLGLSIAIASAYPLVATGYSYIFLGEKLQMVQLMLILIIIGGLFIVSLNSFNIKRMRINNNLKFAFLAFLSWGGLTIMQKHASFYYTSLDVTIIMGLAGFISVILWLVAVSRFRNKILIDRQNLFIIFMIALLLSGAMLFMNLAFHNIQAGVASAIVGSSAIITNLIGLFIYKERLLRHQYVGIIFIIGALFCLSYFN